VDDVKRALIAYGLARLAEATGQNAQEQMAALGEVPEVNWEVYSRPAGFPKPFGSGQVNWEVYEALLGEKRPRETALSCIFSRVVLAAGESPPMVYYAAQPLAIEGETLFPASLAEAQAHSDRGALWAGLAGEYQQLQARLGPDWNALFEGFHHLYRKWAGALPCAYGEPGVSLFEQWKAVAALARASGAGWAGGPAAEFTLIGGDVPGIQDFVYTITSRGAAKGLRGRSLFVQLLGDAVIRRILAELDLGPANVVYAAGGNFMVLGPALTAWIGNQTVQTRLEGQDEKRGLRAQMEHALLDEFEGDLALCLAWVPLSQSQVGSPEFADPVSKVLKGRVAAGKRQRFSAVARERWADLFGPQGRPGNRYCVICQRPLGRGEGMVMEGEDGRPPEEQARRCRPCDGFQKLAGQIGQEGLLTIGRQRPPVIGSPWQEALWRVGQVWYDYGPLETLDPPVGSYLYTINDVDFVADYAHGFRFIANVTPRVTQADVERWQKEQETKRPFGFPKPEGSLEEEERPTLGGIRTFSQMADVARGVPRVGVLRMDVDDLGQIMVRGLQPRTMAATSALSEALDRFFAGRLGDICARVNQLHRTTAPGEDRGDRLYVIYAGGDDLFVVGSWDLLPELATQVRAEFERYTGHNPALHISAGITLEGRKFPLYQAADRAGQAEDQAKGCTRDRIPKDAVCFLGLPVKWDEWVQEVQPRLKAITNLVVPGKAPAALIQVLQGLYARYEEQVQQQNKARRAQGQPIPEEPQYQVYYGPWMWQEVYTLTRMAERIRRAGDESAARGVRHLQVGAASPTSIRYMGLAARWAELLTREEQEA